MSKILIFKGTGQYGSMEYFSESLYKSFKKTDKEVKLLDFSTVKGTAIYEELVAFKPDITIGFNSMMVTINNMKHYKFLNLKHLAILVDHPVYHLKDMDLNHKDLFISCVDESGVNYSHNKLQFNNSFLLNHGIDKDIEFKNKDKEFDVVFFGSINNCEDRREKWKNIFNPKICELLDKAIEIGIEEPNKPVNLILEVIMNYFGYKFDKETDLQFDYALIPEIESYLREYFRLKFIQSIKKHKVTVFGNGINTNILNKENIVLKNPVDFNESIKIMQKSKISLNCTVVTMYKGSHERPLNSAMAGSVVLSNYSPFFYDTFKNNASLVDINEFNTIDDRISNILSNDKMREEITKNARDAVINNHTWDHRVSDLINKFNL